MRRPDDTLARIDAALADSRPGMCCYPEIPTTAPPVVSWDSGASPAWQRALAAVEERRIGPVRSVAEAPPVEPPHFYDYPLLSCLRRPSPPVRRR